MKEKKLKTLKDCLHPSFMIGDTEDEDTDWDSVEIKDLKQAVQELIDELEEEYKSLVVEYDNCMIGKHPKLWAVEGKLEWIKTFFNLEEK